MIISREEFHSRYGMNGFKIIEEKEEVMSVDLLFEELEKDAPFRNHEFMFGVKDFNNLEIQEGDGIIKKFPSLKTEGERIDKIEGELLNGTYESIPVLKDFEYPIFFYVENGFHRVFIAKKLGWKVIRVRVRYGKFILNRNINFGDLKNLLDMISELFQKKSIKQIKKILEDNINKKPEIAKRYSIIYGVEK